MTPEHARKTIERLTKLLSGLVGTWPMTGGTLSVVSRDGILDEGVFGTTFDGTPMSADQVFEIGSISKVFTGLMITGLAEEGQCDLDAPVTRYLPWFEIRSTFGPITLRHLLHHTSGMVKGTEDPPDELGQCWALRDTQTGSAPETLFHYSNLGYVLLGLVIKAITGVTAPDYCRDQLIGPLGMGATLARITNVDRARIAVGTVPHQDDRPWIPGDRLAPAPWLEAEATDGNIASTAHDMGRFMQMLLSDGQIEGHSVLPPGLVRRVSADLAVGGEDFVTGYGAKPVTASRYGLGVNVEEIEGHMCLTHGGGMVGYSSFLLVDMTAGIGICVLTNANGCYPVGQAIARLGHAMLAGDDVPNPILDFNLRRGDAHFDEKMLGNFVGPDASSGTNAFSIAEKDGRLVLNAGGKTGFVYRTWASRLATGHPHFRQFHLGFSTSNGAGEWTYGGDVYRPEAAREPEKTREENDAVARYQKHVGRYRCYSPWFPTFRIVLRGAKLFLIAPGGVEAPDEDVELVETAEGVFRVGDDDRLPERLTLGPVVDGRTISVACDGCLYSRVSTD